MADQPYQFGDVVDGYRWTITGWEPVEPVERTVGVPRLLEARYAATQEAQARQQTQTLEPEAPLVVDDSPSEPDPVVAPAELLLTDDHVDDHVVEHHVVDDATVEEAARPEPTSATEPEPERSYSLEELLGGGRRVVAAPDLAIEYDAEPMDDVESHPVDGTAPVPWPTEPSTVDVVAADDDVRHDEADESALVEAADAVVLEERVDETVAGEQADSMADDVILEQRAEIEAEAEAAIVSADVAETGDAPVVDEPEGHLAVEALAIEALAVEALEAVEPADVAELASEGPVHDVDVAFPAGGVPAVSDAIEPADDAAVDLLQDPLRADAADVLSVSGQQPHDIRPAGMRAWYGLGLDTVEEPEPEPEPTPAPTASAEDDSDAPFAAALALGARRFAERYQPSEIETIARTASSADRQPVDSWSALVDEPIDEWTSAPAAAPPAEQLDARALTYHASTLPAQVSGGEGGATTTFAASSPEPVAEPEPTPRDVVYTPAPPAGWYPGSA